MIYLPHRRKHFLANDTWTANNTTLSAQDSCLKVYWAAEDLNDSKGSNTLTNHNSATFAAGKYNNAFTLNGSNQYLTAIDSEDWNFGSGDATIMLWVRFNVLQDCATINVWGNGTNSFLLNFYTTQDKIYFFWDKGAGTESYSPAWSPSTDTWYHITVTIISGTVNIYIDASPLAGSGAIGGSIANSNDTLQIGAHTTGTNPFNGKIDEVGIWKGYGATQAFVTALYNSAIGAFYTG